MDEAPKNTIVVRREEPLFTREELGAFVDDIGKLMRKDDTVSLYDLIRENAELREKVAALEAELAERGQEGVGT